jgi:hypothetical protein
LAKVAEKVEPIIRNEDTLMLENKANRSRSAEGRH